MLNSAPPILLRFFWKFPCPTAFGFTNLEFEPVKHSPSSPSEKHQIYACLWSVFSSQTAALLGNNLILLALRSDRSSALPPESPANTSRLSSWGCCHELRPSDYPPWQPRSQALNLGSPLLTTARIYDWASLKCLYQWIIIALPRQVGFCYSDIPTAKSAGCPWQSHFQEVSQICFI